MFRVQGLGFRDIHESIFGGRWSDSPSALGRGQAKAAAWDMPHGRQVGKISRLSQDGKFAHVAVESTSDIHKFQISNLTRKRPAADQPRGEAKRRGEAKAAELFGDVRDI